MRSKIFATVAFLVAASAQAQASRTWVSGVGDDANPCSRTAPCKTFAGAISKTAAGGEISALDPGGFGAVTITKSITINGTGVVAGILASGTNGVIINAGVNDTVVLRDLSIVGFGTGLNGIRVLQVGALHVEGAEISGFTQKGISIESASATQLFVKDSRITNNRGVNAGGINIAPGVAGSVTGTFDGVHLQQNQFGLQVADRGNVTMSNSDISNNTNFGVKAASTSAPAVINLESCTVTGNRTASSAGVDATGASAIVRISNVDVFNNAIGLNVVGGTIVSFGNNRVLQNTTNGAPSTTVGQI